MSLNSNLFRAFALCASLSTCTVLQKINAQDAPPPAPKQDLAWDSRVDSFGKPEETSDLTQVFFFDAFAYQHCVKLPESDYTYVDDKWTWDCSGIRPTDSGDFLIEHLLKLEYQKRIGTFNAPESFPDKQAFRFVG